jgi:hypothetical protein
MSHDAKCEAIKQTKTSEIFDTLQMVIEDAEALRTKVYQACERVGVQFDPKETHPEQPPVFGSLPQIHEKIREIGRVINDATSSMREIENFI